MKAIILLLLAVASGVHAQNATVKLHALFDREWDYSMRRSPVWASILGDRRWNNQWEDLGPLALSRHEAHQRGVLDELRAIDRGRLSAGDRLNYDLFERDTRLDVERSALGLHLMPMNHRHGIQTANETADALRFETVQDYRDWIARLRAFPAYLDQTIALMRDGIRRRIVHARVVMERVPRQIQAQIVEDPERSPFYQPFKEFARGIPSADQLRLEQAAWKAIEEAVVPAFRRFAKFFDEEYLPACFE